MTNLQIAEDLRDQIAEKWAYTHEILDLYEYNKDGRFTERIQSMIDRLLPTEVYYIIVTNKFEEAILLSNIEQIVEVSEIKSLPINQVLFSSEDNPLGILK
jgi:hypothetical protein